VGAVSSSSTTTPAQPRMMRYLLGSRAHRLAAGRAKPGWKPHAASNPDLIVCDVQLPDMDGYEVGPLAQERPRAAHGPPGA